MPSYETVSPTLTLTLLEKKHISTIHKNLNNGKFALYLLGREAPLSLSDIRFDDTTKIVSFIVDDFYSLPESNADGITDGVLLVTNNGGEATVIDLFWVTGIEDPSEAFRAFMELSPSQKKSYIHPRLLQNIIR